MSYFNSRFGIISKVIVKPRNMPYQLMFISIFSFTYLECGIHTQRKGEVSLGEILFFLMRWEPYINKKMSLDNRESIWCRWSVMLENGFM